MDKQKRPLYFAFVVCLFCLLATLGIQALSTYVTYQNALDFERSYLKSSVDNTITMIDALRAELRQQQEDRGRQPSETLIRTEIESIMRAQFY